MQADDFRTCSVLGLSTFFEEALSWRDPQSGVTAWGLAMILGHFSTCRMLLQRTRYCANLFRLNVDLMPSFESSLL